MTSEYVISCCKLFTNNSLIFDLFTGTFIIYLLLTVRLLRQHLVLRHLKVVRKILSYCVS